MFLCSNTFVCLAVKQEKKSFGIIIYYYYGFITHQTQAMHKNTAQSRTQKHTHTFKTLYYKSLKRQPGRKLQVTSTAWKGKYVPSFSQ